MLDCHSGLSAYTILSILVITLSIVTEFSIIYFGLQGTMVEISKRRSYLEYVLSFHSVVALSTFVLGVWGSSILSSSYYVPCASIVVDKIHGGYVLLFLVDLSQYIDSLSQFFCCYLFSSKQASQDENGSLLNPDLENNVYSHTMDDSEEEDFNSKNQKVWAKRCQAICSCTRFFSCGIFGGANVTQDIDAVARVMTKLFHHDGFLDVVPSDVLAGILLVRLQQIEIWKKYYTGVTEMGLNEPKALYDNEYNAQNEEDTKAHVRLNSGDTLINNSRIVRNNSFMSLPLRTRNVLNAQRRSMSHLNPADLSDINTLSRLSYYAFAIYTHLLYLYDKPASSLCKLCYTCSSGNVCQNDDKNIRNNHSGDNCLYMNRAAAETVVNDLGNAEVFYANYENDNVLKPYGVFLDHETKSVVIAVRGTLSLEDCITDAICDPIELKEAGEKWGFDGVGKWAHGGILRSALAIREDIENKCILENAFASGNSVTCQDYGLTLVGHSLGAGTAIILSILFQAAYPQLNCAAFGTPGSLLDKGSAQECERWLMNVVIADDIIPRLGVPTMNNIRHQILESIPRSKVNKSHIMRTLFTDSKVDEYMYRPGEEPSSKFKDAVDRFLIQMKQRNEETDPELTIPGRIIHLAKNHGDVHNHRGLCNPMNCCCKEKSYNAQEVSSDAFAEITISPSMALDHFPNAYVKELQKLKDTWESARHDAGFDIGL